MARRGVAWWSVLIAAWMALGAPISAQQLDLDAFDQYVIHAMRAWSVPGIAVAVVTGDSVLHARGYGTRTLGGPLPVDEHTIFAIGSATKAFTTSATGMLVDEGKMSWDAPVTDYLPWFQLADPWVTREITVRDLVTHRSGLPGGIANFLWYASPFDRDEILRRVRHLQPVASFRAEYNYQNIMFLAAGRVVAAVAGQRWDDVIRERIFRPLGMARSVTSVHEHPPDGNVATPHALVEGVMRPIPWRPVDNVAPAGSINSSAFDMAQWLRLHLARGWYDGRRLLSDSTIAALHTPQIVLPPERSGSMNVLHRARAGVHFFTYGLGWVLFDYRGRKVSWHGGNIDGMAAVVAMMPEEDVGVVVLTNRNGGVVREAIMLRVFDLFLEAPMRDWSADLLAVTRVQEEEALASAPPDPPIVASGQSWDGERLVGRYDHPMLGPLTVMSRDTELTLQFGPLRTARLHPWRDNTFRAEWDDVGFVAVFPSLRDAFVTFYGDARGRVDRVHVQGIAEFTRGPGW